AAWRKLLEPGRLVVALLLAVDPAIAQGDLKRLVVGDGRDARSLLGKPQPDTRRRAVMRLQPGGPLGLRCERHDRKFLTVRVSGFHKRSSASFQSVLWGVSNMGRNTALTRWLRGRGDALRRIPTPSQPHKK